MAKLVSKCGIDCGACPWGPYPRKWMTAKDFEKYRNNAKSILGYMPIKTPCMTCQIPDAEIPKKSRLPNRKCLIRRCVDKTGVANCAYCSRFPCDMLEATAAAWNRENIEAKLGGPISEEEYHSFVEPFEGIKRLVAIRASLKPSEIVEPLKVSISETILAYFPKSVSLCKHEVASFKAVYELLANLARSSLGLQNTDTFAQQHKLENQRVHISRFLWIVGNHGKFENTCQRLVVDAKSYIENRGRQKTLAIWTFIEDTVFKALREFGVYCERVPLEGMAAEDLTTGTGYLRKNGWVLWISFEEQIGGTAALQALQTYVQMLDRKYGVKAFRHFQDADMQVLLES